MNRALKFITIFILIGVIILGFGSLKAQESSAINPTDTSDVQEYFKGSLSTVLGTNDYEVLTYSDDKSYLYIIAFLQSDEYLQYNEDSLEKLGSTFESKGIEELAEKAYTKFAEPNNYRFNFSVTDKLGRVMYKYIR